MLARLAPLCIALPLGSPSEPTLVHLDIAVDSGTFNAFPPRAAGAGRYAVFLLEEDEDGVNRYAVFDIEQGSTTFLPYAADRAPILRGTKMAFGELEDIVDLNGDGDQSDRVPRVVDLATGASWSTQFAVTYPVSDPLPIALGNGWLAMLADEAGQGVDLDGNGTIAGRVPLVFDIEGEGAPQLYPIFANTPLFGSDTAAAFSVPEVKVGTDLNGDGDQLDSVVHWLTPREGLLRSTGLAGRPVTVGDRLLGVGTPEAAQGATDLNGDGDASDSILFAVDLESGAVASTATASLTASPGACRVSGTWMAFLANEAGQADLNGDGDELDAVWHAFVPATGSVTNLQLGVNPLVVSELFLEQFLAYEVSFTGSILRMRASESQNQTDYDADGELSSAAVFAYDFQAQALTLLEGTPHLPNANGYVTLRVDEQDQDLNGDGDLDDRVYQLFDQRSQETTNLALAGGNATVDLPDVSALQVSEWAQGSTDLNGNRILSNAILYLVDPRTKKTTLIGPHAKQLRVYGDAIFLLSDETEDLIDYNRDGDLDDTALFAVVPGS